MRTLAASVLVMLGLSGAGCGDDTPPPIDAPVEHVIPTDLGQACMNGAQAGCFAVSDQVGGRCQERCVSIGNFPAICSGYCASDTECGPGAPRCTDLGTGRRACMAMTGDPNAGCVRIDAAPPVDAGVDAAIDARPADAF